MKVALGIGNCALRNFCSVVTRANHYSELRITIAQISNDQLPKQPFTGSNPTLLGALFYRNCNKPWPPRPILLPTFDNNLLLSKTTHSCKVTSGNTAINFSDVFRMKSYIATKPEAILDHLRSYIKKSVSSNALLGVHTSDKTWCSVNFLLLELESQNHSTFLQGKQAFPLCTYLPQKCRNLTSESVSFSSQTFHFREAQKLIRSMLIM